MNITSAPAGRNMINKATYNKGYSNSPLRDATAHSQTVMCNYMKCEVLHVVHGTTSL